MAYFKEIANAAQQAGEYVRRAVKKDTAPNTDVLRKIQTGLRNDHRPLSEIAALANVKFFALDTFSGVISQPLPLAEMQRVVRIVFPHMQLTDDYKLEQATNTVNENAPPRSARVATIKHLAPKDEDEMRYLKEKLGLRGVDSVMAWDSAKQYDAASLNALSAKVARDDEKMFFKDIAPGRVSTLNACAYFKLTCLRIAQSRVAEARAELVRSSVQLVGGANAAEIEGANRVKHAVVMFGLRPCVAFVRDQVPQLALLLAQDLAIAERFSDMQCEDYELRRIEMTVAHVRAAYDILAKAVEGKHTVEVSAREAALIVLARVYLVEGEVPAVSQVGA